MFIPFRKWVLACVFVIATIATARLAGEEEEVARRQLQIEKEKEEETERLLLTMEEAQEDDSIEVRRFSNNGRYLRQIWNDGGSGADLDVSIWRAKDWKDGEGNRWFSLGDIAVSGYGAPASFYLMRAKPGINLEEVFDFTREYKTKWQDKHTGAYLDGALLRPKCPPGSYPLGHVAAKNGFLSRPNHTYTCIKAKYTQITSVPRKILWHDKGSGAWHDVTLMAAGIRPGVSANGGIFTICLNDWKNCVADAHEIDWTDDSRRLRSFGGPNFHD